MAFHTLSWECSLWFRFKGSAHLSNNSGQNLHYSCTGAEALTQAPGVSPEGSELCSVGPQGTPSISSLKFCSDLILRRGGCRKISTFNSKALILENQIGNFSSGFPICFARWGPCSEAPPLKPDTLGFRPPLYPALGQEAPGFLPV